MKIEAYTTAEGFETLRGEWITLLAQAEYNRIFLTWEWQSTWWAAYHPGDLWVLAVRDEAGKLAALAPWFIEQRAKTGRTIRSVGCVDVTDYLEVIALPDYAEAAFATLARYLAEHQDRFDTLDLCNIPEASPVLRYFPPALQAHGLTVEVKPQEVCPVIELPDSWETYLESLDKKNRHELRRKLRRTEGNTVEWYVAGPEHDLAAETDLFLRLMRTATPDKAEFLNDPQNLDFFLRLVPLMNERGWLQLAFLKVDGEYAAAYLNFLYCNEVLVYNSGLDTSVASQLSPGILLLAYLIRQAIEQGYRRFDFLRGDEDYKYRLGGIETRVLMLMASFATTQVSNPATESASA